MEKIKSINPNHTKARSPALVFWLGVIILVLVNLHAYYAEPGGVIGKHVTRRTFDWWLFQLNIFYWPKIYSVVLWLLAVGLVVEWILAARRKSVPHKAHSTTVDTVKTSLPTRKFFVLSLVSVSGILFLLSTDWVARPRNFLFGTVQSAVNDYFYLPLTEFMVTKTVSMNLIIGLVAIVFFFVFLIFAPRLLRNIHSLYMQISECFTRRRIVGVAVVFGLIFAFLYFDIFSGFRGVTLGKISGAVEQYYFLPLTDFIATGVFTKTLWIPIGSGVVLLSLLFLLKRLVSRKATVQQSFSEKGET